MLNIVEESQAITIKELQRLEMDVLIAFKRFCNGQNLKFTLAFGTLLGAVRHRGFIPWDDDVDLWMMRDEYERMLLLTQDQLIDDRYQVVSYKNTEGYRYPFCKLIDTKTVLIEEGDDSQLGVYIDIFPIDIMPNDKRIQGKIIKRIYRQLSFSSASWKRFTKSDSIFKTVFKFLVRPFCLIMGTKRILTKIEKIATAYSNQNTNSVGCVCWGYKNKSIFEKEFFQQTEYLQFEEDTMPICCGYKNVLEYIYGDFMRIPDASEIIPHKFEVYLK